MRAFYEIIEWLLHVMTDNRGMQMKMQIQLHWVNRKNLLVYAQPLLLLGNCSLSLVTIVVFMKLLGLSVCVISGRPNFAFT